MVVLLLTSPFYSVLVGNGYVLIKCYTAPYIRIHADITWIPPFACSLKFESELISQTELAILLACIVSLPLAGFASSFSTHRANFTRSATSFLSPLASGLSHTVWEDLVSTRYQRRCPTKYEGKISFCQTLVLLCLLLVTPRSPCRFGWHRFTTNLSCLSSLKG